MRSSTRHSISSPASTAGSLLLHMETSLGNIAAAPAKLQTVTGRSVNIMEAEYRARLEHYLASMLQAKMLLLIGVLTPDDYAVIDTIIADKYGVSSCSIYRGIDLIYSGFP